MDLFSEEYLAHYGVKGMKWGKNIMAKAGDFLTGDQYKKNADNYQQKANAFQKQAASYRYAERTSTAERRQNTQRAARAIRQAQGYQQLASSNSKKYNNPVRKTIRNISSTANSVQKKAGNLITGSQYKKQAASNQQKANYYRNQVAELSSAENANATDRRQNTQKASRAAKQAQGYQYLADKAIKNYQTKSVAGIATSTVNKGLDFIKNLFGN